MDRYLLILIIVLAAVFVVPIVQITGNAVDSVSVSVQAKVTVLPAYNLSVDVYARNKVVFAGDKVFFAITVQKKNLASISEKIDVNLNYELYRGNTLLSQGFIKTISVADKKREDFSIKIPQGYQQGIYTLKVIATNPQSYTATDTKQFIVLKIFRIRL